MGQNLEIYVPKWYTMIVTNCNTFLEVEVLLTTIFYFVTRKKTQKVVKSGP